MNYLIVGAGFAGAVYARELADAGHTVTVIDKRYHIGGNAYDYWNDSGILIHKYGPHIFHTDNERVFAWLSRFTHWAEYKHRILAKYKGKYFPFPPNNDVHMSDELIRDIFYRPYSEKMWGIPYEQLSEKIINRQRKRNNTNPYTFTDQYQCMPIGGYTKLFEKIFEGIDVYLNTEFDKSMEADYDHVFNSMPIDVYYDYKYGELPYRSIRFEHVTIPDELVYDTAQTNFTTTTGPTRVTEWKHFPCHGNPDCTALTFEYPVDYRANGMERYYPVLDADGENKATYDKYANEQNDKVTFIGRCGTYQYLDMHQVINQSLQRVAKYK